MPILSRKKQLILMEEFWPQEIRAGWLTEPDYAEMRILEAEFVPEVTLVDRATLRETLTASKQAVSQRTCRVRVVTELVGPSANAVNYPPKWTTLLRGSGFHEEPIFQQQIASSQILDALSSAGGILRHNEFLKPGAVQHRVMGDTFDGDEYVYSTREAGNLPKTTTISGDSTGAQFSIPTSGARNYGFAYFPVTEVIQKSHLIMTGGPFTGTNGLGGLEVGGLFAFIDPVTGEEHGRGYFTEPVPPNAVTANAILFRRVRGNAEYDDQIHYWDGSAFVDTGRRCEPSTSTVPTQYAPVAPMYYSESDTLAGSMFLDGTKVSAKAIRGSVKFVGEMNSSVKVEFDGRGIWDHADSTADGGTGPWPLLEGIPYNERSPLMFNGSTFRISRTGEQYATEGWASPCVTGVTIDIGNSVEPRLCAAEAEGIEEFWIGSRTPTCTIRVEGTLESDLPWFTGEKDGTIYRLEWVVGSGDYETYRFLMTGAQVVDVVRDAADGLSIREVTFALTGGDLFNLDGAAPALNRRGGDNELVIQWRGAAGAWF